MMNLTNKDLESKATLERPRTGIARLKLNFARETYTPM